MNKIATYLNEHILGEVSSLRAVRRRYSQDGSVLTITPELVVFAKVTNDIRKVARFAWQLAEKGHVMGITVRGNGTDTTGAAIGKGMIINTSAHLNHIVHVGPKERIVHAQAGASLRAVNDSLSWHGTTILNFPVVSDYATVGGAIANDAAGERGTIGDSVEKVEVVLANGDLIETGKLSKREVSKKRGLQTLEGEIYRKLDGLIDDNAELIKSIADDGRRDHTGYASISYVKAKDGSFDLTPLFIGSQGTLGIISEAVLKADFIGKKQTVVVGIVDGKELGRDIVDAIRDLEPGALEMIDGELFAEAIEKGKKYSVLGEAVNSIDKGAVIYVAFDDFNDRAQNHKIKKLLKLFKKQNITSVNSNDVNAEELTALRNVSSIVALSVGDSESMPPVIDGAYIPADRLEEFSLALFELATKLHVRLPQQTNMLINSVSLYPTLHLGEVSDKQKIFRLMNEYSVLVNKFGGTFISEDGEGRLKANAAWALLDEQTTNLYNEIRAIFDPLGTLNPGVKQPADLKYLVESLRTTYDTSDLLDRGLMR